MKQYVVVSRALQHVLSLPFLILALLLAMVIGWQVSSGPVLVIASGPEGGYFHSTALRYQQLLRARGVNVEVRPHERSLEALAAVDDPDSPVQVGFMAQRARAADFPRTRSLGVIADEPLFVFRRAQLQGVRQLRDMRGLRIAVGPPGSGTRQLSGELLAAYGVDETNAVFLPLPLKDAVAAMHAQHVDVALLLQPLEQPLIESLARDPGVTLMDITESYALARRLGHDRAMGVAQIPRAIFDLRDSIPAQDLHAPTEAVSVVAKANLDPGLMHHLLVVMKELHGRSGLDRDAGRYPRAVSTQMPLHAVAENFYRDGLPFLYRHLPFGMANGLFQVLLFVLPLSIIGPALSFLGVPAPLKFYQAVRCHLWLMELRHMLRSFAMRGDLSARQKRRLGQLRQLLARQATWLDRCKEAAGRLP